MYVRCKCRTIKYGADARKTCSEVPENVYPHIFRHRFGAHYRMGFPLPVIAKLLDHESMETTEIYAHTDTELINAAFRNMEESIQCQNPLQSNEMKGKWKHADEETLAKLYWFEIIY